jgi:hypothetical protein
LLSASAFVFDRRVAMCELVKDLPVAKTEKDRGLTAKHVSYEIVLRFSMK